MERLSANARVLRRALASEGFHGRRGRHAHRAARGRRRARHAAPVPGGDRAAACSHRRSGRRRLRRAPRACAWRRWPRTRPRDMRMAAEVIATAARKLGLDPAQIGTPLHEPEPAEQCARRSSASCRSRRSAARAATAAPAAPFDIEQPRARGARPRRAASAQTTPPRRSTASARAPSRTPPERRAGQSDARAVRHGDRHGRRQDGAQRRAARGDGGGRRAGVGAQAGRHGTRRARRRRGVGRTGRADHELLGAAAGMAADEVARCATARPSRRCSPPSWPGETLQARAAARAPARPRAPIRARRRTVIVEGVGGLLSPLAENLTVCDFAVALRLPLLIAARPGLGTINHTLLTLQAARAAGAERSRGRAHAVAAGALAAGALEPRGDHALWLRRGRHARATRTVPQLERARARRRRAAVAALAGRAAAAWRPDGLSSRGGCAATRRGATMVRTMAASAPSAPTVPSDMSDFTARYSAAWNACDTAAMAELITEDIVWADPALPQPARGVAEVQEFMRASFRGFPDLHFGEPDPPQIAVSGDVVFWAWYMEGTHRGPIDPPGFAATGRAHARRRRRPMDDARRAHRPLPRVLRHERPRAPARHRAGAGQRRRARHGRAAAPAGPRRGDERGLGRRRASTSRSSAPAPPAAPPRGCSRSAARASR